VEDEQLLDEYILNDVGKIWVGPWGSSRGREWIFGQFDSCVLPACQLLLERSGIKAISRGDPVRITRAISRIVSCFIVAFPPRALSRNCIHIRISRVICTSTALEHDSSLFLR